MGAAYRRDEFRPPRWRLSAAGRYLGRAESSFHSGRRQRAQYHGFGQYDGRRWASPAAARAKYTKSEKRSAMTKCARQSPRWRGRDFDMRASKPATQRRAHTKFLDVTSAPAGFSARRRERTSARHRRDSFLDTMRAMPYRRR